MIVLTTKEHVELYALHVEIAELLGDAFSGIQLHNDQVFLYLYGATSEEQVQAIQAVNDHNPAILSHTRNGDVATVTVWLPYDDEVTEVTLEADGITLPAATALLADPSGGVSGSEQIVDAEAFVVTVQGYAHTSMNVEAQ